MRVTGLPPGPPYPSPIQSVGFWTRPLAFMRQCQQRYGKRFTIRLPQTPPLVMLTDPEEVRPVFTAPPDVLRPGEGARMLESVLGASSVILLDEGAHMEQRKLMLPAFHGERVGRLTGLMEEVAADELASLPGQAPVALHPRMQDLTLKIILRAVFGLDPGSRFEALRERLQAMLAFSETPIGLMLPRKDSRVTPVLKRVGPFAAFVRTREEVDEMIFALIAERRAGGGGGNDVLEILLEARHEDGSPMGGEEIRDELLTLLVAGHETTASTLAWAFERLARNPAALARLSEEVDAGEDAYLTATIQETLRIRPTVPNVAPRLVVKPIEVGGWTYEPGCSLALNAYLIHHDPGLYPEPDVFRPERFLDNPPGTYTWIPFGGGRRRCLGAIFAMAEMKVVLRQVLSSFTISPSPAGPEAARRRNITVRPSRGATAVLTERRPAVTA